MRKLGAVLTLLVVISSVGLWRFLRHGVSARDEPWAVEALIARQVRHLAIPSGAREAANPVEPTEDVLAEAMAHFADHCAVCHANDGSGATDFGQGMYPKAPDMQLPDTQDLSDGELFYIIRNGIRFTGMPGFATDPVEEDTETWGLVHFIRRLPTVSATELKEMMEHNPVSRKQLEEEEEMRRFLAGESIE